MTEKLKATIETTTEFLTNKLSTVIWRFVILVTIGLAVNTWNTEVKLRERQGLKVERHAEQIRSLEMCVLEKFAKKAEIEALRQSAVRRDEFLSLKSDIDNIQNVLNNELPKIQNYMGQFTEYLRTH